MNNSVKSSSIKNLDKKTYLVPVIGLLFMFVLGNLLPTWATVTRVGVQYICILIGWIVMCALGVPMLVASITAIAACTVAGYYTPVNAIQSTMGSSITALITFIFVLVYIFEKSGTGEFLVRWVLSRKMINGRPFLFTALFLLVIIIIGSVIGSFGAIMLTLAILNSIVSVADMNKIDDWVRFMLMSVVALSGITEQFFPFKPYSQLYISIYNASLANIGASINDASYLKTALITAILNFIMLLIAVRYVLKPDVKKLKELDVAEIQPEEFKRIKPEQVIVLTAVIVSFFHPFIIMVLPTGSSIYNFMNNTGQALFMGLIISLLSMIRIKGNRIFDPVEAFIKGVNWHVFFAIGAVILIGGAIASEDAGVSVWLTSLFSKTIEGMSIIPIMIIVALIACTTTQFFSNTATAVILSTIIAPIAVVMYQQGINVSVFPAIIGIGATTACLIPSGSGQAAIMLGTDIFRGSDGQKWALSKGFIILGACAIAVILGGVISVMIL